MRTIIYRHTGLYMTSYYAKVQEGISKVDKVRWSVIGATGFADKKSIPEGIMPAGNSELVAVMSRTEADVKQVAEKYGGVQWYTDVAAMLEQAQIDACYIASPHHMHLEHVHTCAQAGVHIFCEKPLARNAQEAAAMVAAADKYKVKFGTAFMMPFHHLTTEAKRLVAEGAIGQVVSARVQLAYTYPPMAGAFRQIKEVYRGGVFMDVGCHATDLVERIIGAKVASVMAMTGNVVYQYEGVEDSCLALYEFDNGTFGYVDVYWACPGQNLVEVNGTRGILLASGIIGVSYGGVLRIGNRGASGFKERLRIESDGRSMYQLEFEGFADAILNDTKPPIPGTDGLWSAKVLDAVYESAETGLRVAVG